MSRNGPPLPLLAVCGLLLLGLACGDDPSGQLTPEQLRDPETCRGCHVTQYEEWAGSMHAYAADDPVFLAMNARGQRETNGALGDFCVKCHAPMAVLDGATTDGLNLAEVPRPLKGVTCYFCHSVAEVTGTHNAALKLADDGVMRGGFADPSPQAPHKAAYSPLHDRDRLESSSLCGACHDIVTPQGARIERTFAEWQESVFSHAPGGTTCSQCHMPRSTTEAPLAPLEGLPNRRSHGHGFPGVDVALTPWPDQERQKQQIQALLDTTVQSAVCVKTSGAKSSIEVVLDNAGAGHSWPSGSGQDRRAWVEVVAWQGSERVYESGVLPQNGDITTSLDPDLWLIRDCMFNAAGEPVHMFWEAASQRDGLLPAPVTLSPADPRFYQTHQYRPYPSTGALSLPTPDRVEVRLQLQPIGRDVLQSLVDTGDLDPKHLDLMPTWTLNGPITVEWRRDAVTERWFDAAAGAQIECVSTTNLSARSDRVLARSFATCAP